MKKVKTAIFFTLCAIGLHTYLTWEYYQLKFALSGGDSLCNINSVFNCDAVAASSYSSFFGIPMSVWGLMTNIVLLLLLLIYGLRLTDKLAQTLRHAFYFAAFTALASIVMGVISFTLINNICLFCIGAYVASFVSTGVLWVAQEEPPFKYLLADIRGLASTGLTTGIFIIAIPAVAKFTDYAVHNSFGAKKLPTIVNNAVNEWKINSVNDFTIEPSLAHGPERSKAKAVVSEFADFLCGHCKSAYPSLSAFKHAYKDVRFEFYSFALDGECNSVVNRKSGVPCLLAKATYCAGKSGFGWDMHDLIFDHQDTFIGARTTKKTKDMLAELAKDNPKVNWTPEFEACIESVDTHKAVEAQGKMGDTAGVRGTPTIFLNGKILPRGQLLPVLKGAYEASMTK